MSIYFQYPAIDEYPNFIYPLTSEEKKELAQDDKDTLNKDQIVELKDYLTLKQL
ncbi:hypothetical protein [Pedobacter nototheniae]|uniref:hypothetical protein n=1 Tax=Pedobacter nototheniae TaxID=2488994 RepID=UPI00292F42A3|nr:hypothetical protein [Pedobacter nototheniae]